MSDDGAKNAGPSELPVAEVRSRRSLPVVWIIPLVAAVIGALLVYRTIYEQGPEVEITFRTADGITPETSCARRPTVRPRAVSWIGYTRWLL